MPKWHRAGQQQQQEAQETGDVQTAPEMVAEAQIVQQLVTNEVEQQQQEGQDKGDVQMASQKEHKVGQQQ